MGSNAANAGMKREGQAPLPRGRLSPGPGMSASDVASHQLARIHAATVSLVAEHGYQALKVRDVVRYAQVSTRAFYEHFSSKEDCFLQTYELISRRAVRRIIAAQEAEPNWRERPRLALEEFLGQLENAPDAARLTLVEAYEHEVALDRAWRSERAFEGMLAESFTRPPEGVAVPPLVVEGMVAGVTAVAREHVRAEDVVGLRKSGPELVDWVLCYPDKAASELAQLDRRTAGSEPSSELLLDVSLDGERESFVSSGDRALILSAVAELAMTTDYKELTAPRVRSFAGVSRKTFNAHFDDVEGCYLAAVELRAGEALAKAARARASARDWPGGVYRAIVALCRHMAGDPFLAKVCLTDDFPRGQDGARSRQSLVEAVAELLTDGIPPASLPPTLATEASSGAIWGLFHHHVVRNWVMRRQIAATLSYLALAPVLGPSDAIGAIQVEQTA